MRPFPWGSWVPHLTMYSHEPRPISVPSGVLIHPSVGPQQTYAAVYTDDLHASVNCDNEAVSLWLGELGPHLTQCGLVEVYLHTKWHFDLSNRLATR